jgi:hypothetical protein
MEPVRFSKAPDSAFNWDRPPSDLLQSQLKHFRHLEKKLGLGIDPELGRHLGTENGAAKYIAAITRALRTRGLAGRAASTVAVMPSARAAAPGLSEPLSLAASAAAGASSTSTPSASTPSARKKRKTS